MIWLLLLLLPLTTSLWHISWLLCPALSVQQLAFAMQMRNRYLRHKSFALYEPVVQKLAWPLQQCTFESQLPGTAVLLAQQHDDTDSFGICNPGTFHAEALKSGAALQHQIASCSLQ